jgi:hypothetical protein
LLNRLDKYFRGWESTFETTSMIFDTSFDFAKLQEWSDTSWDMNFVNQAEESAIEIDVLDAENVVVEIPEDVAIATDPPILESQHPSHTTTIQIQDEHNVFFWLSIAFNVCFFWLLLMLVYERCCRRFFFHKHVFDPSLASEERLVFLQRQHDKDEFIDSPQDHEESSMLEIQEEDDPQQQQQLPQQYQLDSIVDSLVPTHMEPHSKPDSKVPLKNVTQRRYLESSLKVV